MDEIIQIAAETLKMPIEEIKENCEEIPEINAWYFWDPQRGGCSVIVSETGEKLAATSSVTYEKLLEAFKSGRRN